MKKNVLILILVLTCFGSGCAAENPGVPRAPSPTESTSKSNASLPDPGPLPPSDDGSEVDLDAYLTSVTEQSDLLKSSLEHDVLTQTDMNEKSQALYAVWDDALNYILAELKRSLSNEEFALLQADQQAWSADKERLLEEAGREYKGGSLLPLILNMEAAELTEDRVCALYELVLQVKNSTAPSIDR